MQLSISSLCIYLFSPLFFYYLNLDPGKKVALFGILGRRFKQLLHQDPLLTSCRLND